ncbi:hypothetical protein HMPREF1986_01918 [Oribacterium sp. oral taxon 078 str. F0263]|nr:hypothetical protein HMPREF1986_01918 [Oribacterium sp. oral taxon 078 str. F0263]
MTYILWISSCEKECFYGTYPQLFRFYTHFVERIKRRSRPFALYAAGNDGILT